MFRIVPLFSPLLIALSILSNNSLSIQVDGLYILLRIHVEHKMLLRGNF
jgi:hypothetical protein